jgi:hypothetical protein
MSTLVVTMTVLVLPDAHAFKTSASAHDSAVVRTTNKSALTLILDAIARREIAKLSVVLVFKHFANVIPQSASRVVGSFSSTLHARYYHHSLLVFFIFALCTLTKV